VRTNPSKAKITQKLQNRRSLKQNEKKLVNNRPILKAQGMNLHLGAGNLHKMLRAKAEFPAIVGGATGEFK
jgi:hypothetical protein